jgi:hypothetical protein
MPTKNLRELSVLGMLIPVFFGCTPSADKDDGEDSGGPPLIQTDDTSSGGGGQSWYPSGQGEAWLVDGAEDNSLFRMELSYAQQSREGEGYFGWLSGDGLEEVALGPIDVQDDSTVFFESDVGFNALLAGYDRFDAYAGASESLARSEGVHLWTGQVDSELKGAYEQLLISAEGTPGEEGSLRAVETTTETILLHIQETMGLEDLNEVHIRAEGAANAIEGSEEDIDGDGTVATMPGTMAILGEEGLIQQVLSGLDLASAAVAPGHPVKDLANWAYDCTQRIESFAEESYTRTRIATACASSSSCDDNLLDAEDNLQWALEGLDLDEDKTVDLIDEGTIECAIYYVSRMAVMDIATP